MLFIPALDQGCKWLDFRDGMLHASPRSHGWSVFATVLPPAGCVRLVSREVPMESRRSPRFSFQCPIAYSGRLIAGFGTISNLSAEGCQMGGDMSVRTGSQLELRMYMPDLPMKVDLATVRWSKGREFGLEFLRMQPEEQERLSRWLNTLEPCSSHSRLRVVSDPQGPPTC